MSIDVTKKGERFLIRGYTYPIKEDLKKLGCKWDKAEKAWITEDVKVARQLRDDPPKETVAVEAAVVVAKASYKDREYPVIHRKGEGMKLAFTDGSAVFWVKEGAEIVEIYDPAICLKDFS